MCKVFCLHFTSRGVIGRQQHLVFSPSSLQLRTCDMEVACLRCVRLCIQNGAQAGQKLPRYAPPMKLLRMQTLLPRLWSFPPSLSLSLSRSSLVCLPALCVTPSRLVFSLLFEAGPFCRRTHSVPSPPLACVFPLFSLCMYIYIYIYLL